MDGITVIHNQTTNKRYVQIDMDKFDSEYLRDLIEGIVAESRRSEESVPWEEAIKLLRQDGVINVEL